MTWLLESTIGKAVTFYVDVLVFLFSKAFKYVDGDDDE